MAEEIGLDQAYAVQTPDDNRRLYAAWAASYEAGFVDARKYRYPKAIAELSDRALPRAGVSTVADIGAGTGLVGLYLTALRPNITVDAFDISPEMLAEAAKKRREDGTACYRSLYERDLTQPVDGANGSYDALISSGTFTHGHLGPEALLNLLPLVHAGGWFMIGANAEHFAAKRFESFIRELAARGEITEPRFESIHVYEQGSPHFGDKSVVSQFKRL